MAFADPQSITISGTALNLPRTSFDGQKGEFSANDGSAKITVSHQNGKRHRRLIRLDHTKISPDPLVAAALVQSGMSISLVIDTPKSGYSVAEAKAVVDGYIAYLSASTGAKITQVLGGES